MRRYKSKVKKDFLDYTLKDLVSSLLLCLTANRNETEDENCCSYCKNHISENCCSYCENHISECLSFFCSEVACENHISECVSCFCSEVAYGNEMFCENHRDKCYALIGRWFQCKNNKKMGDFCTRHHNNRPTYTIDIDGNTDYINYQ